jgi:hypothetical protein
MVAPASFKASRRVAVVAPMMATPERYHWYLKVTGAGDQVPGFAVREDPTLAVPVIVGTAVTRDALATGAVGAELITAVM